MGKKPKNE